MEEGSRLDVPIGQPIFQQLAIRRDEETDRWIVSGIVRSTNSGAVLEGAVIYVGYEQGHFQTAAMSNLKGEVFFSVRPMMDLTRKLYAPTHLYIGSYLAKANSLKGQILRQYQFRSR